MTALVTMDNKTIKKSIKIYMEEKNQLIDLDYILINDALLLLLKEKECIYSKIISIKNINLKMLNQNYLNIFEKKYYIKRLLTRMKEVKKCS